ncbi:MAG: hypothetical protein SPE92_02975, partial [Anaerovibrio sp.]|nr:hypothetical protein [Anaerovibrio sp.]
NKFIEEPIGSCYLNYSYKRIKVWSKHLANRLTPLGMFDIHAINQSASLFGWRWICTNLV